MLKHFAGCWVDQKTLPQELSEVFTFVCFCDRKTTKDPSEFSLRFMDFHLKGYLWWKRVNWKNAEYETLVC